VKPEITNLFLKTQQNAPMKPAAAVTAVQDQGLSGDVSFGTRKRQILLIERETLDEFELQPGQVRENITVTGIKLAGLEPGTQLLVGASVLEVTLDCAPCEYIDTLKPGLRQRIDGRRGTLCRVVSGGEIQVGDTVRALETAAAAHHS